jgi:hypothetical protein
LNEKQLSLAFHRNLARREGMPIARASLESLRELIANASLALETSPDPPQNRTANRHKSLTAALALANDLLKQNRMTAAVLDHKGGSVTSCRSGVDHYRRMAAARKTYGGGRPRKESE